MVHDLFSAVLGGRTRRGHCLLHIEDAEVVTGAVRHLVDGAGHMPHTERPADVRAAIEETIASAG